jgi:hypothetical protein
VPGVEIVITGRWNTAAAPRASDGHEDRRNGFHDRSETSKSKSPMGICFVVPLLSLPAGRSPLNLENARRTWHLVGQCEVEQQKQAGQAARKSHDIAE